MPNITTKMGQYCIFMDTFITKNIWECDFCSEHNFSIYFHERYYNYSFSKCTYCACNECCEYLFGPFRLVDCGIMERAYESIIEIIKTKTSKKAFDYYKAVKIAYTQYPMRRHAKTFR
jgi:hypothetical protein